MTRAQLNIYIDTNITNKTAVDSLTPTDEGNALKAVADYVDTEVEAIPAGPQGPTGAQGVAGPVGPAGLTWKGAWDSETTYALNDSVGYNGASWYCISPVTSGTGNIAPDTATLNWALLAAQGPQGVQGPQGIQGPPGSSASVPLSYVFQLYQSGTGDPSPNDVYDNLRINAFDNSQTLYRDIFFERLGVGSFRLNLLSKEPATNTDFNKMAIIFGDASAKLDPGFNNTTIGDIAYRQYTFKTYNPAGTLSDNMLTGTFTTIMLYP